MLLRLKPHWISKTSRISGCASILGSWQICHNVCNAFIVALGVIGITLQGMPLLFLNRLQWPLWIAAVALFAVLLFARLGARMRCVTIRGIFGNSGLLLAGLPFNGAWVAGARTVGLFIVLGALLWYSAAQVARKEGNTIVIDFVWQGKKILGGLIGTIAVVALLVVSRPSHNEGSIANASSTTFVGDSLVTSQNDSGMKRMKFTLFDVAEAKELMDQDGDGLCDACGMDINECIESGMMQCAMDPNAKIGLLGSQHIHADFKAYLKGKPFDWSPYADIHEQLMKGDPTITNTSAFIHIHPAAIPLKAGDILHMHATGIPLSLFLRSLGIKFPDGMKAYVNGREILEYQNYVFNDFDKILITDGQGDLAAQLNSITDFAKNH